MLKFLRKWRDDWTLFDTVMASLAAAVFVTSLELTVLKFWF